MISNWLGAHPLKMSVANLSYDVSKKSYFLDLRMFLDDFLVVSGDLPADANPFGQVLSVPSKSEVRDYLARHLIIYFNDQLIEVKADKVKTEDLTIYVTFAIKTDLLPEAITRIRIEDTIYTDVFANQRNIVHIDLPGKQRKSLLFNRYQREDTATW
jgi:hypothetical protein